MLHLTKAMQSFGLIESLQIMLWSSTPFSGGGCTAPPKGTVHPAGGLWLDLFLFWWLCYMPFSSTDTGQGEGKRASPCRILSCGCCSQKYALSSWAGFIAIYLQLLSLPSSTLKAQLTKCLWKCYYLLCSLGPGAAWRFIIWNRRLCLVL